MSEAQNTLQRTPIEPGEAHVLVVEDNVPNFVLIARMLAFMGVQRCEWKTSGWQVVQFADTLPRVDLILMDIRGGFQRFSRQTIRPRPLSKPDSPTADGGRGVGVEIGRRMMRLDLPSTIP
jgi:hypothetical protein